MYIRNLGLALQHSPEGQRPNARVQYAFMDNPWCYLLTNMPAEGIRAPRGGYERGKDELTGTVTGPSCTETSRGGALRCFRIEPAVGDQYSASQCCENNLNQLRAAARRCTYSVIRNVTQQTEAYVRQARRHTQITFPWVRPSLPMSFCAPPATMHLLVDPTSDERCKCRGSVSRVAEVHDSVTIAVL